MAIRGVGIDMVSVSRIEELVRGWDRKFLDRVFTRSELDYCLSRSRQYEHLAGRFAAKEAVIKAIGEKIPWKSIQIDSGQRGKPFVSIDAGNNNFDAKGDIHLSITHVEDYALSLVLIED